MRGRMCRSDAHSVIAAFEITGVLRIVDSRSQAGGPGAAEEGCLHPCQVGEVDDAAPVQVRAGIRLEEDLLHGRQICEVDDAIASDVGVAGVAVAVVARRRGRLRGVVERIGADRIGE